MGTKEYMGVLKLKDNKISIRIRNIKTNNTINHIDKEVPDIFNVFDVCDLCEEQTKCETCIVKTLQLEQYFVEGI